MNYIIGLMLLIITSCQSAQEAPNMEVPPIPVLATKATKRDVPVFVESIGCLKAKATNDVRPLVDGTLTEVCVKEGAWVEAGQCLFQIDARLLQSKVDEINAQVAHDRARLNAASSRLERYKNLQDRALISQNEWEELEKELVQAKSSIDLDQAKLQAAVVDLENCQMKASISGRIGTVDAHSGQKVTRLQEKPLTTISTLDPLFAEFFLTEQEFLKLNKDSVACTLSPLAYPEKVKEAKITFSDNHFDEKTGLILIRALVSNKNYILRPGQSVRVKVPVGLHKEALLVIQKAVKFNSEGAYLYLIQPDNTLSLRPVVLGMRVGDEVIVEQGLQADDLVLTDGHMRASNGAKVVVQS